MRRTGVRAARAAKDPRLVGIATMLVACALIASVNLGSDKASAGTGPLNVRGHVWDEYGNPVADANVTVESFDDDALIDTLYYDATEPDGFYSLTFAYDRWNPNYTIKITAKYDTYTGVNDTLAPYIAVPFIWLNVSLEGYAIPEFSDSVTLGLTVAGLAAMVILLGSRRRGGAEA